MRTLFRTIWNWLAGPHGGSSGDSASAEPARAVEQTLARIRRLSAHGVAVSDDLKTAVLDAHQEIVSNKGTLSPAKGLAFYEASRKLALIAARSDDDPDLSVADSFSRAAANSEYLLKFAAESGATVSPAVQADLIAGQAAFGTQPDAQVKGKFYNAYAAVAKMLGNVTADTIKACRSPRTRRALKRDERTAIALAMVTVIISVLLFTAEAVNKQLTEEVATANDLAIRLRGTVFPPVLGHAEPPALQPEYVHEPCAALTATSGAGEFTPKSQADLDQLQNFAIAVRGVRSRAIKLNAFIFWSECDPFGYCWNDAEQDKYIGPMRDPGAAPSLHDRFELRPALSNYTAEFLCKVQTWQEVRDFAVNIQKSYEATSGGFVAQALPILYALLGAYAYRLRRFGETVRNRTFHPSFADSARLITAIIAGAVAGLFNPARNLSVSPLAIAFLVGYGVEIFFKFLDASLTAFGNGASAAPSPSPSPSSSPPSPRTDLGARTVQAG
jgi:hypothetical protein